MLEEFEINTEPLVANPDIKRIEDPNAVIGQEEPSLFDSVPTKEEPSVFQDVVLNSQMPQTPALATNTLLVAMSNVTSENNPMLQLQEESIRMAQETIEAGEEITLRNKIAAKRALDQMTNLNEFQIKNGKLLTPEASASIQDAYNNISQWDANEKARTALEEQAIENIQDMAARDPVQAQVLMDNLEKGGAEQVMKDSFVKMSLLQQRAEELDFEYSKEGWGKTIFNTILSIVPTNYNFQRTGLVAGANTGIMDWIFAGEALRKQSEVLWDMSPEDFAKFAAKDGELMQAIRSNATSLFGLTDDAGAAVSLIGSLTEQTESDRKWASAWGAVEVASIIPVNKIASVTKTLVRAGARKESMDLLSKAAEVLQREGPEVMKAKTTITPDELRNAQSTSNVDATATSDFSVSPALDLATREEAARKALDELPDVLTETQRLNPNEIMQAYEDTVDLIAAETGSHLKDTKLVVENLASGNTVKGVEFIFGKKAGGGYASERSAINAARSKGLVGESFQVPPRSTEPIVLSDNLTVQVVKDPVDIEVNRLMAADEKDVVEKGLRGNFKNAKVYRIDLSDGGNKSTGTITIGKDGTAVIDLDSGINGASLNLGAGAVKTLSKQLSKEFPEITKFAGNRITGARKGKEANGVYTEVPVKRDGAFKDESGQWFVRGTRNIPEYGYATDVLHAPTQGFLGQLTGRWIRSASRISDVALHGKAVQGGSSIAKKQKIFGKAMDDFFKSVPRQSQDIVQQVAAVGGNKAKWWTDDEFNTLVERGFGRPATEKELEVYHKIQLFNDMDWVLRNDQMYLEKAVRGIEDVSFSTQSGHAFKIEGKVSYTPKMKPNQRIFNVSDNVHYTSTLNPLTDAEFTRLANEGYVLVKTEKAIKLADGTTVDHVMARRPDLEIGALDRSQLAYSEGGHRLYADSYFVKQARTGRQADTGTEFLESPGVFVTAKNIAEARNWASKMDAARLAVKEGTDAQYLDEVVFQGDTAFPSGEEFIAKINSGAIDKDHPFEALFDREMPSAYKTVGDDAKNFINEDEVGFNGFYRTTGKMYTSAKGEILKDARGELATTVDPYEALSTSLRQITKQSGLYNYKQEALERFVTSFKNDLDFPDGNASNYSKFINAVPKASLSMQERNIIESQRTTIKNVLNFETPFEKASQQAWRQVAEQVLGDGSSAGRVAAHNAINWTKEKNPVAFLRGLAFDSKLGMYNLGQLFIQSATMLSATALSPKMGLRGMATAVPLHAYLLKGGSENVLDVLTKRGVGKAGGFKTDAEFKEYARAVYKSGFMDMDGTHVMVGENGPAAAYGSFGDKANRVRENGRMFFYAAETYNRLVAFRIAWDEVITKGAKIGEEGFYAKVVGTADDYAMNMTRESAARWQQGLLSIPTQFWAYNVRMMDAMLGSRFTPAQRLRLLAMNATLSGTAGIPIVDAVSDYMKNNGTLPAEIPVGSLESVLDRGLLDNMANALTGADIRIGEKVGTGGWLTNTVKDLFGMGEYGEKPFAEVVGGASYSILKGMGEVGKDMLYYTVAETGGDMGADALRDDEFLKLAGEISTFGNITKAILAANYGIYKSKSGTIYPDLPKADAFYIALGFKPQTVDTLGHMMSYTTKKDDAVKDASKQLKLWRQEAFYNHDKVKENARKANALLRLLPKDIRKEVVKTANQGKDHETLVDHVTEKFDKQKREAELYNNQEESN